MTRYIYGASGASQVVSLTGVPTTAAATAYNARTGGSVLSDIQTIGGAALAGVVTPDSFGQALFLGPDGYTDPIWLDFGSGPRWGVNPIDIASVVTVKRAALAAAEKASPSGTTARNALPYTSGTIGADQMALIDPLLYPKYASAAARNAAITSPSDMDIVRRTDTHLVESYNAGLARWVPNGGTLISEQVLANSTTTIVNFTGIPASFKHLMIMWHGRAVNNGGTTQAAFNAVRIRFNSDNANNYYYTNEFRRSKLVGSTVTYEVDETGGGGSTTTGTAYNYGNLQAIPGVQNAATVGYVPGYSTGSSARGGGVLYVPNYASGVHTSFFSQTGFSASDGTNIYTVTGQAAGTWTSTSGVTGFTIYIQSSNYWSSGSIISIYGLG